MRKRVAPGGRRFGGAERARRGAESVDRARARRQPRIVGQRGDAVAVGHRAAGFEILLRRPGGDDVVVAFVVGRQFHQFDAAFAPALARLDPVAGPEFVGEVEILVVIEGAVALDEAESAHVVVEEGGHRRRGGVARAGARSTRRRRCASAGRPNRAIRCGNRRRRDGRSCRCRNIEESGAILSEAIERRANSVAVTSTLVSTEGTISKRKAPVADSPSSSA